MYVYIHIYIYIYTHTYIHIYTYTQRESCFIIPRSLNMQYWLIKLVKFFSQCSHLIHHPAYYQSANRPMVNHAPGHMLYGYALLIPVNQRVLNKSSREHNKAG